MKYLLVLVCLMAIIAGVSAQLFPQYPCSFRHDCSPDEYCDNPQGNVICLTCLTNCESFAKCWPDIPCQL